MTDAEELRSDALAHAIALYGSMSPGDDVKNSGNQVITLASVFALFISEGPAHARRVLENGLDTAEVIRLVVPNSTEEGGTTAQDADRLTLITGTLDTHAEDHLYDIG